jgi:branched-subunit amino acid aminotransferase/4-amino-4-deoxychorismate lyase
MILGTRRSAANPFKLTISPYPVNSLSPLAGVKSCNYLEQILVIDEAKGLGFDEGVRLNERGEIASATMANVFWLKDDVLFTPSLKTGCLPGTTREFVLENLKCREVEADLEALQNADAVFLTSAGLGVVRVAVFDERSLPDVNHPIVNLVPNINPRSG